MKILVIDNSVFEGAIFRLLLEGNTVYHYNEWKESLEPTKKSYGEGILDAFKNYERIEDYAKYIDKADVIVFTDVNNGELADDLRKRGYNVVGASGIGCRLETERGLFQKYGLFENVPKEVKAKSFEEAVKILESGEFKRPVVKADSIATSMIKTYVSVGVEDAIDHLQLLNEEGVFSGDEGVLICEYIDGVEVAIGAFVSPNGFVEPFNINFEHKPMFPGDLGPLTGEAGTAMFNLSEELDSFLLTQVLKKHEDWYKENYGYAYVDINMIISYEDGKPYILEYTSRFGYPHIFIWMNSFKDDLGKVLYELPRGKLDKIEVSYDWFVGVRYFSEGYIRGDFEKSVRVYISDVGIDLLGTKIIPCDISLTNGSFIGKITPVAAVGSGEKLIDAIINTYSVIKEVHIPNGAYRNDIGFRLFDQAQFLYDTGYLSSYRYETIKIDSLK